MTGRAALETGPPNQSKPATGGNPVADESTPLAEGSDPLDSVQKWKQGDIAMVVNYGGEEKVVRYNYGHWLFLDGSTMPEEGTLARPLAVIDPEDREQVERLGAIFCKRPSSGWVDEMQAALREFANPKPPKPDEPTGLGAVVRTVHDELYVRDKTTTTVAHWKRARGEEGGARHRWDDLAVVEVLSKGYEAGEPA